MSRDVKSTDITGINDGLERAIARLRRQLRSEIQNSKNEALLQASKDAESRMAEVQQAYSQADQEELRQQIEEMQSRLGAQINDHARQVNQSLLENDARLAERLQELSDSFQASMIEQQGQFTEQMQAIVDEQYRAFDERMEDMYSMMDEQQEQIVSLSEGLDVLGQGMQQMNDNLAQLQEDIDERFELQQTEIDTLQQGVKTLFDLRASEENEMKLAAGRALALLEAVRKRTNVKRFASATQIDRVEGLEKRLKGLASNPLSCTISDVNQLVNETQVMEKEALREQAKWQVKQNLAKTTVDALLRMMQDSMQLKVNSIHDETQQEELQADYWTHGKFHELEERIDKVKQRVYSEEAEVEELDDLIKKMRDMEEELDCLREEAVRLGLLSEERIVIMNDILNDMNGWELKEDVGFLGGDDVEDEREGTFAILYNPTTKEELSIIIYQEERGDNVGNRIVVHRNVDGLGESRQQLRVRMQQIKAKIEKSGHKLGELSEPPRGGDGKIEQAQSGAELRRKGAAKRLKDELRQRRNR